MRLETWMIDKVANPAGLEPATTGLEIRAASRVRLFNAAVASLVSLQHPKVSFKLIQSQGSSGRARLINENANKSCPDIARPHPLEDR